MNTYSDCVAENKKVCRLSIEPFEFGRKVFCLELFLHVSWILLIEAWRLLILGEQVTEWVTSLSIWNHVSELFVQLAYYAALVTILDCWLGFRFVLEVFLDLHNHPLQLLINCLDLDADTLRFVRFDCLKGGWVALHGGIHLALR